MTTTNTEVAIKKALVENVALATEQVAKAKQAVKDAQAALDQAVESQARVQQQYAECCEKWNLEPVEPGIVVGAFATIGVGSDSYPAVITSVSKSGKTITAEQVKHTVTERKGAGHRYSANRGELTLDSPTLAADRQQTFTLRKNGRFVAKGEPIRFGRRITVGDAQHYYDPSF